MRFLGRAKRAELERSMRLRLVEMTGEGVEALGRDDRGVSAVIFSPKTLAISEKKRIFAAETINNDDYGI